MTHLDLFSGIGGFSIAAQNCGFQTVAFCEIEPYAQQVLKEKFGAVLADAECKRNDNQGCRETAGAETEVQGQAQERKRIWADARQCHRPRLHPDIFTLNGADYAGVTLLTGGFPCQPFSVAGKRRGKEDDRHLWPEMCRVIAEARPAWVLGENVAGIVAMELDNCLSDLEAIGYAAWPLVIPACACDARHRRDRVWIVAHADERGVRCARLPAAGYGQERHAEIADNDSGGCCRWPDESAWVAESGMGRVAHGIPNRAHRLRGLGNAIVPAVAEEIIRTIAAIESGKIGS